MKEYIMKEYIVWLWQELLDTNIKKEKNKLIKLLEKEKDVCNRIILEYSNRQIRSWITIEWETDNEYVLLKIIEKILIKHK